MERLAGDIATRLAEHAGAHAVLIRRHGVLHLGPHARRRGASRRDPRVPLRGDRTRGGRTWLAFTFPMKASDTIETRPTSGRSSPACGIDYERDRPRSTVAPDAPSEALLVGLPRQDRRPESAGRLRDRGRDRRLAAHAEPRRDAEQVQLRALARRRRSPLHRRRPRPVSHPSAGRPGVRHRSRSRRSDPRAEGHASLVRSLRRSPHPRDPAVPGHERLDAALHAERRRQGFQPVCFGPAYLRPAGPSL